MKIDEFLNLDKPCIMIESDCRNWDIEINSTSIVISHRWDDGYLGRGSEEIEINKVDFEKLLKRVRYEKSK